MSYHCTQIFVSRSKAYIKYLITSNTWFHKLQIIVSVWIQVSLLNWLLPNNRSAVYTHREGKSTGYGGRRPSFLIACGHGSVPRVMGPRTTFRGPQWIPESPCSGSRPFTHSPPEAWDTNAPPCSSHGNPGCPFGTLGFPVPPPVQKLEEKIIYSIN